MLTLIATLGLFAVVMMIGRTIGKDLDRQHAEYDEARI